MTISEVLIKILSVVWVIILARSLSIESYGIYNVVISYVAIFSFLPDLGVGIVTIREIAENRKKAFKLVGEALILNSLLALLTLCIALSISIFIFPYSTTVFVGIALFTLFVSTIRSVAIFYFDGMEKMHVSAFLNTLNSFLLLLFPIIAILALREGLTGIFVGMLIGTFLSLCVSYWFLFKKGKIIFHARISDLIDLLKQGLPLGIAAFAALVYSRIDVILLSQLLSLKEVGIYSAAVPFPLALVQLLNVPFVVAVFPALTRVHVEDHKRFVKAIKKSLLLITAWSVPLSIFVSVFAPVLLPLLFGNKYDPAIPVLQLLIFTVPFISLSALLYKVLIILRKQKIYLYVSIFGACINITLNLFLIKKYMIMGAVYASLLTQVVLFALYLTLVFVFIKKLYGKKK